MHKYRLAILAVILLIMPVNAQSPGGIEGTVTLQGRGTPLHNATVMIVQLDRLAETDDLGHYIFTDIPAGVYDVVAYMTSLSSDSQLVEVAPGKVKEINFQLRVAPLKQEVTVTATGREQFVFEAVHSTLTLDTFDLAENMAPTLGEVLDTQPGVAKTSFGPGSTRPVIRGFGGDRVLVLQDGLEVGALGSQSGDHGEPIDPSNLERLEVVKGPATLLYGSNALGGVVNAIGGYHSLHQHAHEGFSGHYTGVLGSTNAQFGSSASFEYGAGNFLFWGGGGGQRTDDYESPLGLIENSQTRVNNASMGLGWYGEKPFFSLGYDLDDGRYGIPFAAQLHGHEEEELEAVDLAFRRHNIRLSGGFRDVQSLFSGLQLSLNYSDWEHNELELFDEGIEEVGTAFDNRQLTFKGTLEQQPRGPLSGTFGVWAKHRDYDVAGEEALSPPVKQNNFAVFALEELDFEAVKVEFGARLEHTRYAPQGLFERAPHEEEEGEQGEQELIALTELDFTGFSAGAGLRIPLWTNGALVANYTHSYRAPALEELYNFGPHTGNLTFEIGNPGLTRELSNGIEFSLRHSSGRLRAQGNVFYYNIGDFIFLAPTGEIEDGLVEALYFQADSRYAGVDGGLDLQLQERLWLNLGLESVDAELKEVGTPLPRIPPLRARIGVDFRSNGLSIRPELILADEQEDIFVTETRTPGYGLVNLIASYTLPRQHFTHHFVVNVSNLGDRLYRNHLSFIKELAPEMGRRIRLTYSVRFF
ncbi:MAG: TonB-dependent receptor [Acidobacteriota bacterium]